jgi:hypothetical protein
MQKRRMDLIVFKVKMVRIDFARLDPEKSNARYFKIKGHLTWKKGNYLYLTRVSVFSNFVQNITLFKIFFFANNTT